MYVVCKRRADPSIFFGWVGRLPQGTTHYTIFFWFIFGWFDVGALRLKMHAEFTHSFRRRISAARDCLVLWLVPNSRLWVGNFCTASLQCHDACECSVPKEPAPIVISLTVSRAQPYDSTAVVA